MAIDISGGMATEAATEAAPARASDMAALSDDALLQELNLGSTADTPTPDGEETSEEAVDANVTAEEANADAADAAQTGEGDEGEADAAGEAGGAESEAVAGTASVAQFAVYQGIDEVEIPADLQIVFPADGETRQLPLDRVVRLAQMGFYNEQRANEIREFREQMPQIETAFTDLQEQNRILTEGWRRVLSGDEEYLAEEQQQFYQARSPEARAERAEAALQQERQRSRGATVEQQATQFVQGLVPEFENLQTVASEVSFEEVVGKFNILTAPLMVRGQIPPSKFGEVERIIRSELRPWAEAQHARRIGAKQATTATVNRATATSAAAKKQAARAVLPQGTHPTGAPRAPEKKYEQAGDILNDIQSIVANRDTP